MIRNEQITFERTETGESWRRIIEKQIGPNALRWYIARITDDEVTVEATLCDDGLNYSGEPTEEHFYPGKSVVLSTIPTGIGCRIGGFAGDAAPATNLLAATADYLITNPNAVNASDFIGLDNGNVIYADGCSIDLFCRGLAEFRLPYSNRIGVVIEQSNERDLEVVFNLLNTVRAVHGANITDYVITERPIGGRCHENKSGAFVGTIDNPGVLLDACEKLINRGVSAIAVTSNISDLPMDSYARHFAGEYPNPIGGVEAIISYLITNRFRIPSAHAPMINVKQLDLAHNVVDARGAGEFSSASGLACILVGLRRAPQISPRKNYRVKDIVNLNNLSAIVAPSTALGGIPAIYAQEYSIPVIAVQENRTILDVTSTKMKMDGVIEVRSYAEAAGILLALKHGISLESLARPLNTLRNIKAFKKSASVNNPAILSTPLVNPAAIT
jgi:hypothetical protein